MFALRTLREVDLGSVAGLLMRAFIASEPDFSLPRLDFLRMHAQACPSACLVAPVQQQLAGVVFGHALARLGWIGPLAVSPDQQRNGLGRELLLASAAALLHAGCEQIGLDSSGDAGLMAFYQKAGLRIGWETGDGLRSLREAASGFDEKDHKGNYERLIYSQCRDHSFTQLFSELQNELLPGLDYLPFLHRLHQHGRGDGVLFMEQGRPHSAALVELGSRVTMESGTVVRLALAISKNHFGWQNALALIETFICARYPLAEHLYVRALASEWAWLTKYGYSRRRSGLRWLWRCPQPVFRPFFCMWE
jgi:predicted N-acetyltransferase YhbS